MDGKVTSKGRVRWWARRAMRVAAILVVLVGLVAAAASCAPGTQSKGVSANASLAVTAPTKAASRLAGADKIEVVDFHRTQRCASCIWLGQASRLTVETYFNAELASGKVTFREVDVQKPENAALVKKFKASGSSLYLNYIINGTDNIVEASRTYPYVGNEVKFNEILRAMIAEGLRAGN